MKHFSAAAERNKTSIFNALETHLCQAESVLEIGSGTGQHFTYTCERFPKLHWQCSDTNDQISRLKSNLSPLIDDEKQPPPIALNVDSSEWISGVKHDLQYDAVYTANTLHIMSEMSVRNFFSGLPHAVRSRGHLFVYGPFKINGVFTSESNRQFDRNLRETDSQRGIREIEWIVSLAKTSGFALRENLYMPANNQLLLFQDQG